MGFIRKMVQKKARKVRSMQSHPIHSDCVYTVFFFVYDICVYIGQNVVQHIYNICKNKCRSKHSTLSRLN